MIVPMLVALLMVGLQAPADPPDPGRIATSVGTMQGREADARVARIAFRLAVAGRDRCLVTAPAAGIVFQHLTQFELVDRAGVAASHALDQGAGVIAVVPDGPAAAAGVHAGDVLLAVDGAPLPPEEGITDPFEPARAQARADSVDDLFARPAPVTATLLRDGERVDVRVAPRPACPSRVRLARSDQRNAYADGRRVLVTTGLISRLRDDNELAFVLAHEMAHNILGHAAVMRGGSVAHGIGRTLGRSGRVVRGTERDADALAGELMLDAGYDPVAGAGVLTRLGRGGLGLFAEHDRPATRIAAMTALVAARRPR